MSADDASTAGAASRRPNLSDVLSEAWRRARNLNEQPRLWLLALVVGAFAAYAAVLLVLSIDVLSAVFYSGYRQRLVDAAGDLSPWMLIALPTLGGLAVGLLFRIALGGSASFLTVADVIEARACSQGRISWWRSFISTVGAGLSLGMGASAGREGPAVVAAAGLSSVVSDFARLDAFERRTLLGCSVAAAVSASFNAPIAGALFALEVVLGHYAVRAFAPIAIASVAGAVISRLHLGDEPAFEVIGIEFGSYAQFPALFLLGLVSAIVAMLFMAALQISRDVMDAARARIGTPIWLQPAFAGLIVGLLAAAGFPEVLGVGYQTTSAALAGVLGFWTCVVLVIAKTFATAVTLGGRFAGGVFSPALMLGALTGSAFGAVASQVFPSQAGDLGLYALAGMGAVSGAVLGAPISTILIVFELTADYEAAIAVMVSTSVATVATQQIFRKSYFHWQLAKRGVDLIAGPEHSVLPSLKARHFMRWRGSENGPSDSAAWELASQGVHLAPDDDFQRAFDLFRGGALTFLPVLDPTKERTDTSALLGALFYVDALSAYNRALLKVHEEEHS